MSFGTSVWNEGAAAARAGLLSTDCPYPPRLYHFVVWHNGWSWAMYLVAKEEDDERL